MPKRELKDTEIVLEEKRKAETVTVKGTVTKDQRIILQKLIGRNI